MDDCNGESAVRDDEQEGVGICDVGDGETLEIDGFLCLFTESSEHIRWRTLSTSKASAHGECICPHGLHGRSRLARLQLPTGRRAD